MPKPGVDGATNEFDSWRLGEFAELSIGHSVKPRD
jgi:hypothetical protein